MSVQKPNFLPAILILAGIVLLAAVGGLYAFSETDETIQGQADVTEYRVSSKVPGRILKYYVKEGQTVRAGDTLAVLEAPDVTAKMAQARAAEQMAEAQHRKAEKGARQEQIAAANALGETATSVMAQESSRKDALSQAQMQTDNQFAAQQIAGKQQRASDAAQAASTAVSAGLGMMGNGLSTIKKKQA